MSDLRQLSEDKILSLWRQYIGVTPNTPADQMPDWRDYTTVDGSMFDDFKVHKLMSSSAASLASANDRLKLCRGMSVRRLGAKAGQAFISPALEFGTLGRSNTTISSIDEQKQSVTGSDPALVDTSLSSFTTPQIAMQLAGP
jgi:hypothetical protein